MNDRKRKLAAAFVAQRTEMGEREWFCSLAPLSGSGIQAAPPAEGSRVSESLCDDDSPSGIVADSLEELHRTVCGCLRCPLGKLRKHFVFGSGDSRAKVMFVGEAPGADEDEQGLPFVGRAGQLLTKMIESIGLPRPDVFIANVLKCRPPGNRTPQPLEIEKCEPILIRQVEIIKPSIICALGRVAGCALLKTNESLAALRGKVHSFRGIKLIVTYHPAALLRNPQWKRPTWEDLKFLRREFDGVEIQ
jgi:uracil-DNA glycosylase